LEHISCLYTLEKKNNNVDHLTQGEEINTQRMSFFEQELIYCSKKGEGFYCEAIPSMEPTHSQLKPILNILMGKVIPFKETTFENISLFLRGISFS